MPIRSSDRLICEACHAPPCRVTYPWSPNSRIARSDLPWLLSSAWTAATSDTSSAVPEPVPILVTRGWVRRCSTAVTGRLRIRDDQRTLHYWDKRSFPKLTRHRPLAVSPVGFCAVSPRCPLTSRSSASGPPVMQSLNCWSRRDFVRSVGRSCESRSAPR